jgi:hypothetical protein
LLSPELALVTFVKDPVLLDLVLFAVGESAPGGVSNSMLADNGTFPESSMVLVRLAIDSGFAAEG